MLCGLACQQEEDTPGPEGRRDLSIRVQEGRRSCERQCDSLLCQQGDPQLDPPRREKEEPAQFHFPEVLNSSKRIGQRQFRRFFPAAQGHAKELNGRLPASAEAANRERATTLEANRSQSSLKAVGRGTARQEEGST